MTEQHSISRHVSQQWTEIPELDKRAQISAARALPKIANLLNEWKAHFAMVVLEHLDEPPRKSSIHFWVCRNKIYTNLTEHRDPALETEIEQDVGIDMVPLAVDLYRRWPKHERPETIVLISDGHNLVFNPGRPEAVPEEIVRAHLNGSAAAALLIKPKISTKEGLMKLFGG